MKSYPRTVSVFKAAIKKLTAEVRQLEQQNKIKSGARRFQKNTCEHQNPCFPHAASSLCCTRNTRHLHIRSHLTTAPIYLSIYPSKLSVFVGKHRGIIPPLLVNIVHRSGPFSSAAASAIFHSPVLSMISAAMQHGRNMSPQSS